MLGMYKEAEQTCLQAMSILRLNDLLNQTMYGGRIYTNLGQILGLLGRNGEAITQLQKAVLVLEESVGTNHEYYLEAKNDLDQLENSTKITKM